jgi:hypothetical protein
MTQDWTLFITIAGLLFGIAVSIHFFTVKRPGIAIRWLGGYTLLMTISLMEYLTKNSSVLLILGGLTFLFGPFLFLYVRSRILGLNGVERRSFWHFLPFVSYVLLVVLSPMLTNESGSEGSELLDLLIYELLFLQIFWYCISALKFISSRQSLLTEEGDPDLGKMKIAFLRILVSVSIILFAASFIGTHIFMLIGFQLPFEFKYAIQIALCLLIFVIALLNTETMHAKKLLKTYSI